MKRYKCRHYDRPCYKEDSDGDVVMYNEAQAEIDELVKAFEKITEARGYRSVEDEALIAKHRGE